MPPVSPVFLHQRFLDRARRQPAAPALAGYAGGLSYGELAARSAALARRLAADGIGAEDIVAICTDWPPDYLVAMLAVMRAGAAWLPLEPAQPAARREEMLRLVSPALVLTGSIWRDEFPGQRCLCVDLPAPETDPRSPADAAVEAAQLCYLIFTSGSTGQPKPVMVTHGNVAGLFDAFTARYGLGPRDRWSWCHSVAFGFSVWEIWGALSHGACLVAVPPATRRDPWALREVLAAEAVSVLSQTPSAFRQLLHVGALDSQDGLALRLLVLSGEALDDSDLARWFERQPADAPLLLDTYALTETAGQVCWREYRPGAERRRDLGECLPGVRLAVLDEQGRPADRGELYISGPGVARGYLGDPELTARRFVTLGDGRRYYRSGDRVQRAADGRLSYLGRCDTQIKWRGHRIEPAEVEAQLRRCPGIADAAVALHGDGESARLVAWYLPQRPRGSSVEFWPSLGPWGRYDRFLYDLMAADRPRLDACRAALREQAPGRIVLDMGCGEQALFARMAAEAGARHVYAVERLPEAAERARRLVEAQGLAERISVLHADLADVDLPERAEVAVQGITGNIGSADGIVAIWRAARRLFAPGCEPVPRRCITRIAPVELPDEVLAQPAFADAARPYVEALLAGERRDLRLCLRGLGPERLLAAPALFEDLDFRRELTLADGDARFRVSRPGRLDGFLLWTVLDCGAGEPVDYFVHQQAWLPVFLPLPDSGPRLAAGTELQLAWRALLRDSICPDYCFELSAGERRITFESPWRGAAAGSSRLHERLWETLDATPDPARLRARLAECLPDYMLPTAWIELPALPLTSNGKLDRSALPAPAGARPEIGTPFVAPRNAREAAIAGVWADVLGVERVGVDDDFFALGGDSLLAVRLLSELQQRVDAGLSLAALFAAPTVAGLAAARQTGSPAVEEGVL
ncbi:MAG: amino acid adenylation domain-containing protein [Gammaproteobacteria bacterium]|nr:MAG: amino acid adenylation domain-containing protein [Gammaproteobacteria bacterium]